MAVAVDSASALGRGTGIASPLTYAFTNTAGTFLVVRVTMYNDGIASDPTGVTYGGVALTKQVSRISPAPGVDIANIWTLDAPPTGANNVVISWAAGNADVSSQAVSVTGEHATLPVQDTDGSTGNGTTAVTNTPALTVDADGMLFDALAIFNVTAITAGADQGTLPASPGADSAGRYHLNGGASEESGAGSAQAGSAGGTMSMSWTTNREFAHVAIAIAAAAGGGGGITPLRTLMGVGI